MYNIRDIFTNKVPTIIAAFAIAATTSVSGAVVYASTSIGDNISTDGTLDVSGTSVFMSNVGIGTTTPAGTLEVAGEIRITANDVFASGVAQLYKTDANGLIVTGVAGSSDDFVLTSSPGSTVMQVPTGTNNASFAGNVGIGTTNPSARLSIQVPGFSNTPGVNMFETIKHTAGTDQFGWRIDDAQGSLNLDSLGGTDFNVMHWNLADGNVGIGTTTPLSKLTVYGGVAGINGGTAGDTNGYSGKFTQVGYDTTLNKGFIQAGNFGTGWTDLVLNPIAGNVGIGTTTPIAEFEVAKDAAARIDAVETSGNVRARLSTNATQGFVGTVTNHPMAIFANNDVKMTVLADGNVGIGTTDPKTTLQVQTGDIYMPSAGTGIILKDDTNDACYRIKMSGGAMLNQQVVCP